MTQNVEKRKNLRKKMKMKTRKKIPEKTNK